MVDCLFWEEWGRAVRVRAEDEMKILSFSLPIRYVYHDGIGYVSKIFGQTTGRKEKQIPKFLTIFGVSLWFCVCLNTHNLINDVP